MANKKTVHHRNQITALILWMRCFGRHNNKPPPSGGFFTPACNATPYGLRLAEAEIACVSLHSIWRHKQFFDQLGGL